MKVKLDDIREEPMKLVRFITSPCVRMFPKPSLPEWGVEVDGLGQVWLGEEAWKTLGRYQKDNSIPTRTVYPSDLN